MRWLPQTYPIGQLWSYNNASFYVAGRLIEVVTGKPFAQVAREELLTPLGMTDTGYRLTDLLTAKVAMGFSAVYGDDGIPQPAAGMASARSISSAASRRPPRTCCAGHGSPAMAATMRARNDLSLASRELLRELRVPAEVDDFVGLCWFTRDLDGVRLMWHGGSMRYQQSRLIIAPERGFAFIALTNSERGSEHRPPDENGPSTYLGISDTRPAAVPGDRSSSSPMLAATLPRSCIATSPWRTKPSGCAPHAPAVWWERRGRTHSPHPPRADRDA